jgi:transcription initiation factor TFIID subunit 3
MKMSDFSSEILRIVVGHCSHNVGWNGIQASSLDLLTEVLQKYIVEIGQLSHRYSEQCKYKMIYSTPWFDDV